MRLLKRPEPWRGGLGAGPPNFIMAFLVLLGFPAARHWLLIGSAKVRIVPILDGVTA
jgi:hypothetical protein